jgi:site-specific DNA-methyltransferase (adenine-specific)
VSAIAGPSAVCIAGDARDEAALDRALGGVKADLLLTDPPYCLLTRRRARGDVREPRGRKLDDPLVVRFDDVRSYRRFTEAWLPLAMRRMRPNAPVVLWTNFLGKQPMLDVAAACGYRHLHGEFIWGKQSREVSGNERTLRVYEVALVLGTAELPPQSASDPPRCWSAVGSYADEADAPADVREHPHHKPFYALEPLIRAYSRPGDVVLDPFAGSGSIADAALRLGRRAACVELDPKWAATVTARISSPAE